jgi:hypothetical protein
VTVPCAPGCSLDDVAVGLAQLSQQIQGLAGYMMVVSGIALALLIGCVVLLFVNAR